MNLYECDFIINVICHHPEDSSRHYSFGVKLEDVENMEADEFRRIVEERVNKYGYWHEVEIIGHYMEYNNMVGHEFRF